MTHRKLIEQMLEALRGSAGPDEINNVREAAREYLAQPEQSEQTPTAETNDATFGAILFSFIRLSLVYPNEAQLHQLDRLIAFYGDQKFASQLRLLAHQARTPNVNRGVGRTTHLKFSGSAGIGTAPPLRELSEAELLQHGHAKGWYMNKCIRCGSMMELVDKLVEVMEKREAAFDVRLAGVLQRFTGIKDRMEGREQPKKARKPSFWG